jgi:hypothetical protein
MQCQKTLLFVCAIISLQEQREAAASILGAPVIFYLLSMEKKREQIFFGSYHGRFLSHVKNLLLVAR